MVDFLFPFLLCCVFSSALEASLRNDIPTTAVDSNALDYVTTHIGLPGTQLSTGKIVAPASSIKFPASGEVASISGIISISVFTESLVEAKINPACRGVFAKHRALQTQTPAANDDVTVVLMRMENNIWSLECQESTTLADGIIIQHQKRSMDEMPERDVEKWIKAENSRSRSLEIKEFDLEIGVN